jgi:hypothetical protein
MTKSAAEIAATPPEPIRRGRKHTPSVEEQYGELERQGLVRIIRRRGKPPLIKFL